MSETLQEKTERNFRVQSRYDELMREGKRGHYETIFRVVREEVERAEANAITELETALDQRDRLVRAMEAAMRLIGAINDTAPPAVKESNINMAWHILDQNLKAIRPPALTNC